MFQLKIFQQVVIARPSTRTVGHDGQECCVVTIRYRGIADTVFVTGCWLQWEQKVPMVKVEGTEDLWETHIDLPLEYHYAYEFKFLVDGEWTTSSEMATKGTGTGADVNVLILVPQEGEEYRPTRYASALEASERRSLYHSTALAPHHRSLSKSSLLGEMGKRLSAVGSNIHELTRKVSGKVAENLQGSSIGASQESPSRHSGAARSQKSANNPDLVQHS